MLLLLRHGQASFGAAVYDRLSPLGHAQAVATAAFLRSRAVSLAEVCVGPRLRHQQTADGVLGAWDAGVCTRRQEAALDEFSGGHGLPVGEDPPAADAAGRVRQLMARIGAWVDGRTVLPDGLTLAGFRRRVGDWMKAEVEACNGGHVTLVVTSGGVVAAAVCEALQLPDAMFLPLVCQIGNGSLTELAPGASRPLLRSLNCTGHLPAEHLTWI